MKHGKMNAAVFATKGKKKDVFLRILGLLAPYKKRLIVVLVCLIFSVGANLAGTLMLASLLDVYIAGVIAGTKTMLQFSLYVLLLALVYLLGSAASYGTNRLMVSITTKALRDVRDEMFTKMQALPISFFDTHSRGDLMSRFTNDTDTLREMISQGVPQIIMSTLTIVGMFIAMLCLSPLLTLIIVGMLVIMVLVVAVIGGKSGKYFVQQQISTGNINGFIEEHVEGQKVVKVFNHEEHEKRDFDQLNEELRKNSCSAHTYANILMPVMGNIGYVNYAVVAAVGAIFCTIGLGGMTIGKLASFLQFSRQLTQPISQLSQQMNSILMALAGAERIFQLIDEKPEVDDGYVTLVNVRKEGDELVECEERTGRWAWKHPHKAEGTITYKELLGAVEFQDVTFGYEPNKTVLKDITIYANPGQKIAFVGSTGAGKTTITNLINRFYDVPDGKIRYDGININKIKKDDLRRSLAMVLQDTHLFTGTVLENIRYGRLNATDEECIEAAKLANAHWFIEHLPDGYNTLLSQDGTNLSQGQRQLLAISRAMVANPPVLILDEATSSIDTRTEALIEKGMDALMQGRTVFVIAHRLSTVRNSDVIIVLEHGEIIERGNHEQLIAKKGRYYQLYTGAFELD